MNHVRALIKRHYSGVYFLFDREHDLVHYQTLFADRTRPEYQYNRKTGKITPAAPTSSLMPLSTYATVFSSFTSPTPTQGIPHKKEGGDECPSYRGRPSVRRVWCDSARLTVSRLLMPTASRTTRSRRHVSFRPDRVRARCKGIELRYGSMSSCPRLEFICTAGIVHVPKVPDVCPLS